MVILDIDMGYIVTLCKTLPGWRTTPSPARLQPEPSEPAAMRRPANHAILISLTCFS